jgi:membrane peptidoglycan carboxypeptidase
VLFEGAEYLRWLGIAPQLRLPLAFEPPGSGTITPLQMALVAAALSNGGTMPAPRLALSYRSPEGDWIVLPSLSTAQILMTPDEANAITIGYQNPENAATWEIISTPSNEDLTWYLAGTMTEQNVPLALVLVLEEQNPSLAEEIGQEVLAAAMGP